MGTSKPDLRQKFKMLRLAMSPEQTRARSQAICQRALKEISWEGISTVSIYRSIPALNEVDTAALISKLKTEFPSMAIDVLGQSKSEPAPSRRYDLIFVPCLAFDSDGYRLGWGGGFYDKFLTGQADALKVGLCFADGFFESPLPREPHDIPLDKVITED